jgi:hypothetical protein
MRTAQSEMDGLYTTYIYLYNTDEKPLSDETFKKEKGHCQLPYMPISCIQHGP